MEPEKDEPLTPAGRLFLRPEMDLVINSVIAGKDPIDLDAVRSQIENSVMIKHPRFCSLLVRDPHGREHWRKTQVHVDRHLVVRHNPLPGETDEEAINDYVADLAVSSPLGTDKPLWEIHLLMPHKAAILRFHHALGDGVSLMSMFLTCCRRADDPHQMPTITNSPPPPNHPHPQKKTLWGMLILILKAVCFTVVFVSEFVLRSLWVRDRKTAVSGGAGVELWPRKLVTARFLLDDMKTVKRAVADATINDVLFGVISSGLSKYLDIQSPKALKDGLRVTGLAMVNLRPQPGLQEIRDMMRRNSKSSWGNKFGMVLLPVYYYRGGSGDPLEYVKRAKKMIDKKKLSFEAHFSYTIGNFVMSCLGPKYASLLNYRVIGNTTFTISNVVGPKEEITIAGNPLTSIRVTSSSLSHAITMHMVSYAGRAYLQILVAKDIIPNPRVLAKCFEDSLLEMKIAAEAITRT